MKKYVSILLLLSFAVSFASQRIPVITVTAPAAKKHEARYAVGAELIQQGGATDLQSVLRVAPGVQTTAVMGGDENPVISLRGFGENAFGNTLLVKDGVPLRHVDMETSDLLRVDLNNIAFIEVLPGSQSVRYGDSAVGGVVIVHPKPVKEPIRSISASVGSYHRFAYGVQIADKVKQGYFYDFSAKRSLNHHYRDHDKSGFSYVNLKGGIDNRYGQYALYYDVFNHAGQFPGALTGGEIDINRQMVAPGSENSFVHARTQSLTFTAKKILKNSFIVRTHGRLSSETMTGNLISDFSKRRNARLISPSLEWLPERGGKFITGIEYADDAYQYANKSAYAQDAHDKRKNASLYAISRVPLKEQWSFGLGARGAKIYDQLNESSSVGGVIVTEQALYFNPTNAMSFYLKRAGNYRFPKVDEQNNQEAPPAPLKTQRGISYEVGGRYTESRYRLQADLYQLNIKNEIAYAPAAPGENNATNRNLDPTRRTGILFSARIALSKTLCSDVNFSYVHARYMRGTFEGNELPFVSSMLGRLAVTKAINEHWSVLGESLFTGRRYAAEDDANGGGQLGSFTVYNAAVSFKYQQVAASLRVNNISNKRYYNYVLLPAGFENVHYPAAERNVVFQVSYDFV